VQQRGVQPGHGRIAVIEDRHTGRDFPVRDADRVMVVRGRPGDDGQQRADRQDGGDE
jgi:hypothetical protein